MKPPGGEQPSVANHAGRRYVQTVLKRIPSQADTDLEQTMQPNPDHHTTRRIVLPSGRSIEVVRFFSDEVTTRELHICPECDSQLVQPIDWNEAPQGFWELLLSCPNCDWSDDGVFDQDQVDALEERLDDGLTEMLTDLRSLTQSNMNQEFQRFAAALHADLILPEDF
jgi:hypothetical protein